MSSEAISTAIPARSKAVADSSRWLLPVLACLFFATGISGLMYQVLWLRILTLTFGVTVHAVATVLGSFMAGLGLGSYLAGKVADRVRSPLLTYGFAEILVGVFAALTLVGFQVVHAVYVAIVLHLPGDSLLAVSIFRAALAFLVLIIPTSLMGATLPIIIKSSFLRSEGLGGNISLLYAVNTLGAMTGAFSAGFFLIGSVGIQTAILIAASINILAGVAAIGVARIVPRQSGESAEEAEVSIPDGGYSERILAVILLVFAISGFCSLAYEVVWTRILSLLFAATTYAFTLMLTTVLLAIAAGSYAINLVINRRGPWLIAFAAIELLVGLWAIGSIQLLSHLYGLTSRIAAIDSLAFLVIGENRFIVFVSLIVMFPPMFLLGMTFPIAAKLFISNNPLIGRRIGTIYAANVIGAIFGSFAAGFLLVPWLGSRDSLILLAAINMGLGVVLLLATPRLSAVPKVISAMGAAAVLALMIIFGPPMQQRLVENRFPGQAIWHQEGLETTVSVVQENEALVLYLNGQHQANNTAPMVALHRLIGHLPMLLHPDPKAALSIGLGGGATPGAISQHSGVDVTIVELSQSVIDGSDFFRDVNYNLLERPNVHMRLDDGRNFLLLTDQKFDVITADVIKPRHAGSANLYSADYYSLAKDSLTENGLMVIWLDPSLPDYQYKLMIRTFTDVFPYVTLWDGGQLIIGSKSQIWIDTARIERALADPNTGRALREGNINSLSDITSKFVAADDEIRSYAGDGPIITDNSPLIEYFRRLPTGGEPDRSQFSRNPNVIIKR